MLFQIDCAYSVNVRPTLSHAPQFNHSCRIINLTRFWRF